MHELEGGVEGENLQTDYLLSPEPGVGVDLTTLRSRRDLKPRV